MWGRGLIITQTDMFILVRQPSQLASAYVIRTLAEPHSVCEYLPDCVKAASVVHQFSE